MASPKLFVSVPTNSNSTGSFPIRAPLTPDNDDSSDNESSGYKTDSSDSHTSIDNGSELDIAENSETALKSPFLENPLEETVVKSDDIDKDSIFRPIIANPDEERSVKSGTEDEENEVAVELDSVDRAMLMPVAQLSLDDDEFDGLVSEEVVSEEEDVGTSDIVNVLNIGVIQRVDSAPRVKVLLDDDDSVLGSEDDFVVNYSVPVALVEGDSPVVSVSEENVELQEDIKRLVHDFVSAELVKNEELNSKANKDEPLVERKEGDLDEDSGLVEDVKQLSEKSDLREDLKLEKVELSSKTDQEGVTEYGSIVHDDAITFASMENNINNDSGRVEARSFSLADEDIEDLIWGNHEKAHLTVNEPEQISVSSYLLDSEGSPDQHIVVESYDKGYDETDDEKGKKLLDSAFQTASEAGLGERNVTLTSASGSTSTVFSLERPAGSGSLFRSVRPSSSLDVPEVIAKDELSEEETKKVEKIQHLMLTFLSLVQGIGHFPEDSIVAQVLQRLVFITGRHINLESILASAKPLQHEGKPKELDFSLNILVIGKSGVGKSATINSIFANNRATVDAFQPATMKVKEIIGTVDGVRVRVLDTPGLKFSAKEEATNRKILSSIKKLMKKFPPDVFLYVDRLDAHTRDFSDLPLLSLLTECLSTSIWRNAIVTLTHAASPLPDGPSGSPLKFEEFVAQRSRAVQQAISQAVGDIRLMHPSMMHPVALVENHPVYQKNGAGESILPNGQNWRSQLLLLCYSLKILSEANRVYKTRDTSSHTKFLGYRFRALPLSHLVSSLLQTRPHRKLPDQGGDDIDSDVELMDLSDEEDEDDYDKLPFKPLRKSQVGRLNKEQRKEYYEEYDYRVKLFQKKQLREEVKRLKEMKKQHRDGKNKDGDFMGDVGDEDDEDGGPTAVPVALPDFVLPPSFDSDYPSYRYRVLEPTSELTIRPVLDMQGWDHDCGYDGVSIENNVAINGRFPGGFTCQMTKDKKEFKIHLDSSVCVKHGESASTMAGLDIQSVGRQLAYIIRSETKFRNFKINKTTGGISITFQGKDIATGLKIEDQITAGKRLVFSGSAGAVTSSGDAAFGANFEVRLKAKDYPIDQDQSTLGLSLMKYRRELGLVANVQSQFSVGRSSKMAISFGMNSRQNGQISIKTSSSSELQIALFGILPVVMTIIQSFFYSNGTSAY